MKNTFLAFVCLALFLNANQVWATADTTYSKSTQSNGYWVAESNVQSKDFTIVRFYDATTHTLLYEQRLEGKHFKARPADFRRMNRLLSKFLTTQPAKRASYSIR